LRYGSTIWKCIKEFCDGKELCNLYSICSTLVQACSSFPSTNCDSSGKLHGLIVFFCETPQAHAITSNLEQYLDTPLFPLDYYFIFCDWKIDVTWYPILSIMVCVILEFPISTLTLELAFWNGALPEHIAYGEMEWLIAWFWDIVEVVYAEQNQHIFLHWKKQIAMGAITCYFFHHFTLRTRWVWSSGEWHDLIGWRITFNCLPFLILWFSLFSFLNLRFHYFPFLRLCKWLCQDWLYMM